MFIAANEPFPALSRDKIKVVFNEEIIGTATRKDLAPIFKVVREREWNTIKSINSKFYKNRWDLSATPTDCLSFDNKMVIPRSLEQFVINAVNHKHPGRAAMLAVAHFIRFPKIYSKLVTEAHNCRHSNKADKNLKPVLSQQKLFMLNELSETSKEVQRDFAIPISYIM